MPRRKKLTPDVLRRLEDDAIDMFEVVRGVVLQDLQHGLVPVTPRIAAGLAALERDIAAVRAAGQSVH